MQPSPSRQRRLGSRSTDSGRQEDGGEHLLAKMKEKNRSAQRRYRERIKARPTDLDSTGPCSVGTAASLNGLFPGGSNVLSTLHDSRRLMRHVSCAVTAGGKRRASSGADAGRCYAEGPEGVVYCTRGVRSVSTACRIPADSSYLTQVEHWLMHGFGNVGCTVGT